MTFACSILIAVQAVCPAAMAHNGPIAARRMRPSAVEAALAAGDPHKALERLKTGNLRLSTAQRLQYEGRAYYLLEQYGGARKSLEAAAAREPRNPDHHYWLGRVLAASGTPALAAKSFEQAGLQGMDSADLHLAWARALRDSGRTTAGLRRVRLGKSACRPSPGDVCDEGLVLETASKKKRTLAVCSMNSALGQVHQALQKEPASGDALLLCAQLWAGCGRHQQAVKRFEQAAAHLPDAQRPACHGGWAASLLAMGDLDGYLQQARLQIVGDDKQTAAHMAAAYDVAANHAAARGNLKMQIHYLDRAVEHAPTAARCIHLADALVSAGDEEKAARQLRRAQKLDPSRAQHREIARRLRDLAAAHSGD